MSLNYQPTCSLEAMRARAKMYAQIRQFLLSAKCWKWKRLFCRRPVSPMYI